MTCGRSMNISAPSLASLARQRPVCCTTIVLEAHTGTRLLISPGAWRALGEIPTSVHQRKEVRQLTFRLTFFNLCYSYLCRYLRRPQLESNTDTFNFLT